MRLFLLTMVGLLATTNAFADCAFMPGTPFPPPPIEAKIDTISAPVYDAEGKLQKGCILSSGGEVLGYAREHRLCHMKPGKTVKVSLFPAGCCDTGPGPGTDFTCGVRAKSPDGTQTVYGNGMSVQSIAP